MDKIIYGADTETHKGRPMTLQFYSEDIACSDIFYVNEKTAARTFLKWCEKRRPGMLHVLYIHNLGFDLVELLWGYHDKMIGPAGDFDFSIGAWSVKGVYGTPTFCTLSNGQRRVMLVDTYSYFRGSLAHGAALFCPDLPKLSRPDGIGEKLFKPGNTKFESYAMRDAEVTFHMGQAIEKLHREYDLPQCVSVADMAAKIFRRRFLDYIIPQPSRDIVDAALLSYHGGKNNLTVERGWYDPVTSLDISSAYPHAMHGMPAFSNVKLYRRFAGKRVKSVPEYGVYSVTGKVADCSWPVVFSHGFKPLHGDIRDVYLQGFEVNEALRSGELKPESVRGWYYDAEHDLQAPALRGFVETFYRLKERETDPVMRYMQKLILNSISGKFIQTRKSSVRAFTDIDAGVTVNAADLIAGGMFHPFIASAITAHTRARIHQLEHKYKALHTATDGIMTLQKNARGEGKGLGAVTVEASNATLMLIRNKCYVLYVAKPTAKTRPSYTFKGRHILKSALHGFQGSVTDLEQLIASNTRRYSVNRPNRLREALKKKVTPNEFVRRDYVLKVGELKVKTS